MVSKDYTIRRMRPYLGTFVEVGVQAGAHDSRSELERGVGAAFAEVALIHKLLSFHASDSDLTRLNQAEGRFMVLHRHSLRVLRLARDMTVLSNGLFNCTVGSTLVDSGSLPDHGGKKGLASGEAVDIEIERGQARLKRPVKITLDGIAKGYAVDCAVLCLKHYGVKAGWVNAGGDMRVFGDLILPVQRRELDNSLSTLGGLQNAALASSQVGVEDAARFPGKIVNPVGAIVGDIPVKGVWSVMARQAWRADALTKVASLANSTQRAEIIASLGGVLVKSITQT